MESREEFIKMSNDLLEEDFYNGIRRDGSKRRYIVMNEYYKRFNCHIGEGKKIEVEVIVYNRTIYVKLKLRKDGEREVIKEKRKEIEYDDRFMQILEIYLNKLEELAYKYREIEE